MGDKKSDLLPLPKMGKKSIKAVGIEFPTEPRPHEEHYRSALLKPLPAGNWGALFKYMLLFVVTTLFDGLMVWTYLIRPFSPRLFRVVQNKVFGEFILCFFSRSLSSLSLPSILSPSLSLSYTHALSFSFSLSLSFFLSFFLCFSNTFISQVF